MLLCPRRPESLAGAALARADLLRRGVNGDHSADDRADADRGGLAALPPPVRRPGRRPASLFGGGHSRPGGRRGGVQRSLSARGVAPAARLRHVRGGEDGVSNGVRHRRKVMSKKKRLTSLVCEQPGTPEGKYL